MLETNLGRDWLSLDPTLDLITTTEKDREVSLTFGGPILKDRLWFYTAFDDLAQDVKEPLWPVVLNNKNRYFDVKISAEPVKNQSAWFAYHLEKNSNTGGTWGNDVPWDSSLQYGNDADINTISSQWEWFANSKNLFSAKYLGFWTQQTPTIPEDAPQNPGYINWWKWKNFGVNGHFPYIEAFDSSRHTVQADMTRYVEQFLGQQDIKFGVQYTTGSGKAYGGYFLGYLNRRIPTDGLKTFNMHRIGTAIPECSGTSTRIIFHHFKQIASSTRSVLSLMTNGRFPRLTLNLGLRFDNMSNKYGTGQVFVQPIDPHQDITSLDVARDRQGTDDIFDFNNWSPRVGGTYQITADAKTIASANFGRYYMPVGLENLRRLGPDMPLAQLSARSLIFRLIKWT